MKRNLGENPPQCDGFSQKVLAVYHREWNQYDYKILTYLNNCPFGKVGVWFDSSLNQQEIPTVWYDLPNEIPFINPEEICITGNEPKSVTVGEAMGAELKGDYKERKVPTAVEVEKTIEKLQSPAKLGGEDEPKVIEVP